MNTVFVGQRYEQKAASFLISQGYEILEMNYRSPHAEIDIIAKDKNYLVFIEVKYRNTQQLHTAFEAVNKQKQRKIIQAAIYYMHQTGYGQSYPCRFDVVGINRHQIQLIKNAFEIK